LRVTMLSQRRTRKVRVIVIVSIGELGGGLPPSMESWWWEASHV
jgi:hypothetical protein